MMWRLEMLRQPENDNGASQESRYSFSGCLCLRIQRDAVAIPCCAEVLLDGLQGGVLLHQALGLGTVFGGEAAAVHGGGFPAVALGEGLRLDADGDLVGFAQCGGDAVEVFFFAGVFGFLGNDGKVQLAVLVGDPCGVVKQHARGGNLAADALGDGGPVFGGEWGVGGVGFGLGFVGGFGFQAA